LSNNKIVTPAGKAVYPKITKPDTFGEYADNKYKTNLELSAEDMAVVKAQIEDFAKTEKFKVSKPKMPWKDLKDGTEVLVFKSGFKPFVFDAKKNPLPEGAEIGGGSTIRVAAELYNYEKGVSLRLKKVQVLELVKGGSSADEFDVEDGFEVEASEDSNDLDI
jgi:hypothetical protein